MEFREERELEETQTDNKTKKTVLNDMKRISSNPIRISKMTDNKLGYIPWNE